MFHLAKVLQTFDIVSGTAPGNRHPETQAGVGGFSASDFRDFVVL